MVDLGRFTIDHRPLTIPAFRRLWLASVVTAVGGQLAMIAVPQQLYVLTGSSASIGASGMVSFVVLTAAALWGGVLADVRDRRRLLLATSCGIAATSVFLWAQAAVRLDSVAVLLLLVAVQRGFVAADAPAMGAALPRLVPVPLIPAANSLTSLVGQVGSVTGPLLAGAVIPVIGVSWLYLIDSIALCTIVWAVHRLPPMPPMPPMPPQPNADPQNRTRGGETRGFGLRHLGQGVRHLAGNSLVLCALVADLAAMVLAMPAALFPALAHDRFGDPPGGGAALGLLYAAYPAGVFAMGMVSATITRAARHGAMVTVAVITWGITMIGLGLSSRLRVALGLLFAGGAANFVLSTFRRAIAQTCTRDELRGRTQGILTVVTMGGPSLGYALHGVIGAAYGTTWAISGGGALAVLVMIGTVVAAPAFWQYRSHPAYPQIAGQEQGDHQIPGNQ